MASQTSSEYMCVRQTNVIGPRPLVTDKWMNIILAPRNNKIRRTNVGGNKGIVSIGIYRTKILDDPWTPSQIMDL